MENITEKKLNFGCGLDFRKGYDNMDKVDFDFNVFPYPIKDNTYNYVYSRCVLEHLLDIERILMELMRICKDQATIFLIVPYYNSYNAFSEVGHTHYFNDRAFYKYIQDNPFFDMELKLIPSTIGKYLVPCKMFRHFLSRFIGGLISQIHITLKVKKENLNI